MRMTNECLRAKINHINCVIGKRPDEVGSFQLDCACGGVRLTQLTTEAGSKRDISERVTKGELGRILDGIINTLYAIK